MKNNKLDLQSKYKAKISFDDISSTNDILVSYYLPIIKSDAFSLYSALSVDARNTMINSVYVSIDRLVSMINLSVEKINESISRLEIVNLIELYRDEDDNITFNLKKPLSPMEFNESEQFTSLMKSATGKDNLNISNKLFNSLKDMELSSKEKLTKKVDISDLKESNNAKLNVEYDFDSIKNILNARKLDWSVYWSNELEESLLNLIVIYRISSFDVALAIIELIESNQFSLDNLSDKIRKDFSQEVDITSIIEAGDRTTEIKLDYIGQLKVRDYFVHRLDRQPTTLEEKMISELMGKYNLDDHKVNLLIDYSIIINEGVVNVNYINKIAETVVKEKLDTPEKIVQHLKTSYQARENKKNPDDDYWNRPSELEIKF